MNIEDVERLASGYRTARILHTALALHLFDAVQEGATSTEIALEAGTDERATGLLLNALVSLDLLEKKDGRYHHTRLSREYLTTGGERSRVAGLRHTAQSWDRWTDLPSIVQTGDLPERESTFENPDRFRTFILAMQEYQQPHAAAVAEELPVEAGARILDCGGGPGTYARAFARTYPGATVTLFDLPEAIDIARVLEGNASLRYLQGDFFRDDLGGPYDLILLSNIIHSWSPEENRKLIGRLAQALDPGGRLMVRDRFLQENEVEPRGAVLFSLHMLVSNFRGQCYKVSEVRSWMAAAGLEPGRYRKIGEHTELVMGTRAGR